MAYPSQSRSSRGAPQRGAPRGGSGRGGGGGGGGGGGTNAMAYGVAGVVVILIVVVFMVASKNKPKPAPAPVAGPAVTVAGPAASTPTAPPAKPFPPISNSLLEEGRTLATTFDADAKRADVLYEEARQAKGRNDETTWQSKMREAVRIYDSIKSRWNDFVGRLPTGNGYDVEDMARHYFPRENGVVAKFTKNLAAVKTDLKLR